MLTEYIYDVVVAQIPKLVSITASSKEEAEVKLKETYGEDNSAKLIDIRRLIY